MGTATRKRKKKTFIPRLLVLSLFGVTAFASISYFKNLWSDGTGIVGTLDSPVLKLASLQPGRTPARSSAARWPATGTGRRHRR